jgi:hypothetical protein
MNDDVHVFHGNSPEQHAVAHDKRTREALPVSQRNQQGPHVGHHLPGAIGDHDLTLLQFFKLKLKSDMLRNPKQISSRIGQRIDLNGRKVGLSGIHKFEPGMADTHIDVLLFSNWHVIN